MQTKEFAAQTVLSAATLRYYEQEGCCAPNETPTATANTVRAIWNGWVSSFG